MKKILLLLFFSVLLTSAGNHSVYVCMGGSSQRYHATPSCRGLRNCSTDIEKITLSTAKEINRTPCKICYK